MKQTLIVLALLCTNLTFLLSQEAQDCINAQEICSLSTFHVSSMRGHGRQIDDLQKSSCSKTISETNSSWLKWRILEKGTLTFTLDPSEENDDLDFVLYKAVSNCSDLQEVRCMTSGRSYNKSNNRNSNCEGKTGLALNSVDEFELSGCKYNDDNYLKFLQTEVGEEYILFVNNYTSGSGYSITIESSGRLSPYTSCQENESKQELFISNIYPNPATDKITVEVESKSQEQIDYEVLRIDGSLIKTASKQSATKPFSIDVNTLPNGTYILRIIQDEISTSRRFIKQ